MNREKRTLSSFRVLPRILIRICRFYFILNYIMRGMSFKVSLSNSALNAVSTARYASH